jgi:single stranded DNA-binding protein
MKTKSTTQLIGYLGTDPVIKKCSNGRLLATLRIATDTRIEKGGAITYRPTWHNVAVWGELVNRLDNVIKGSHVLVEGSLEYQIYIDGSGHKRYVTEVNAHSFTDLDR